MFSGGTVKTISCAEIIKRHYKPVFQVTRVGYQIIQENWVSTIEQLEDIVVKRKIPTIHILTSLDPIEFNTPGFQINTAKSDFTYKTRNRDSKAFSLHEQRNPRRKEADKKQKMHIKSEHKLQEHDSVLKKDKQTNDCKKHLK